MPKFRSLGTNYSKTEKSLVPNFGRSKSSETHNVFKKGMHHTYHHRLAIYNEFKKHTILDFHKYPYTQASF